MEHWSVSTLLLLASRLFSAVLHHHVAASVAWGLCYHSVQWIIFLTSQLKWEEKKVWRMERITWIIVKASHVITAFTFLSFHFWKHCIWNNDVWFSPTVSLQKSFRCAAWWKPELECAAVSVSGYKNHVTLMCASSLFILFRSSIQIDSFVIRRVSPLQRPSLLKNIAKAFFCCFFFLLAAYV